MAAKRKALSKKIRYEVFKRDKFTCQYCGRVAPDVILQVDHIKPVSKGGKNDIMNLITSCRDCNLGKGAREISDDSIVKKQRQQLSNLADKNEQLEMMLKWRDELQNFTNKEIDIVNERISQHSKWMANEKGKRIIKKLIQEFSIQLVLDAVDIAFENYFDGTERSWEKAFHKIGGICNNKTRSDVNNLYYFNYLKKACNAKYRYYSVEILKEIAWDLIKDDDDFEFVKSCLSKASGYERFIDIVIGGLQEDGNI